jgi:hypothetical protein
MPARQRTLAELVDALVPPPAAKAPPLPYLAETTSRPRTSVLARSLHAHRSTLIPVFVALASIMVFLVFRDLFSSHR